MKKLILIGFTAALTLSANAGVGDVGSAASGTKLECFKKYGEKSQFLVSEQIKQEGIAGDLRNALSDRSAALATVTSIQSQRRELLFTLDSIINAAENANGFDCPVK
jgi:hypothetical protein